jgi:probable F420-dependent oxidoreductase
MEFGLALPTFGPDASPEAILEVAQGAERIGLASVWTFERLLRPVQQPVLFGTWPITLADYYATVYDPLETLAYVAARTSRVRLGTSVLDSLFHSPVVLGRRLATLDRLSDGRVVAGLGQGWMQQEFETTGVSPKRRGAGFEEHVEALRAVWRPDPVSFDGRFYRIPESQIGPKPVQAGGPPILLGGSTPAALERAGRLGAGLNPVMMGLPELEQTVTAFRDAARAAGHDTGRLPVVVRVNGAITDEPLAERPPLTGSVEQVAEDVRSLERLGIDEVFWSMEEVPPADQLRRLERLVGLTV